MCVLVPAWSHTAFPAWFSVRIQLRIIRGSSYLSFSTFSVFSVFCFSVLFSLFICLKYSPFLPPALLRHNWHTTLCKFKVCNMLMCYTYILQYIHHNIKLTFPSPSCRIVTISFWWWEHWRSILLATTVVVTIITVLCIRSPELICLANELCTLQPISPRSPIPMATTILLWFWVWLL